MNARCYLFGHKWKYNFPSLPSKAICIRCKIKASFNATTLTWIPINEFKGEKRTDDELINKWVN